VTITSHAQYEPCLRRLANDIQNKLLDPRGPEQNELCDRLDELINLARIIQVRKTDFAGLEKDLKPVIEGTGQPSTTRFYLEHKYWFACCQKTPNLIRWCFVVADNEFSVVTVNALFDALK
jgi:hypothetical protein